MRKIVAVLAAGCVALASVPSLAAEASHHHADGSKAAKSATHKRHLAAKKPKSSLEEEALWPVYFYGCEDGEGDGLDCD